MKYSFIGAKIPAEFIITILIIKTPVELINRFSIIRLLTYTNLHDKYEER